MYKYIKKIVKYAKKKLKPDQVHFIEMFLTGLSGRTTITEIDLEFVNYCNLRCKWCSLDHGQSRAVMSEETLRKFFNNIYSDRRFRSIEKINLFNGGEILLHPRLMNMLEIIREYKKRFGEKGFRFPVIDFLTNGVALNVDLSKKLVEMEILDIVRFSVDGGSREKYEELRKGAKWDLVSRNIRDFAGINKGKIKTGIICIIEHGKAKETGWMTDEFKEVCSLVDNVELRYPHDWMGDVKVDNLKKVYNNYCKFLFSSLVVLPDGNIVVCCGDLNGKKGVIGNLRDSDLFDMYNSKKRRQMRYDLLRGRRDRIELCSSCSGYC